MEEDLGLGHELRLQDGQVHENVADGGHGVPRVDHLEPGVVQHEQRLGDVDSTGIGLKMRRAGVRISLCSVIKEMGSTRTRHPRLILLQNLAIEACLLLL